MTLFHRNRLLALAGGLALGLGLAPSAQADVADDAFRTGGCSGCFNAQVTAALRNFSQVTRVYRGCGTGGGFPGNDACDGAGGGDLLDFVVLEGNLRNSNTDANGYGVPGGANGVLFRVSANGSSNGIRCANDSNPQPIGFLALEGFDGLDGTFDDAGGTGVFRALGAGKNANNGNALGTATDIAAPLRACDTDFFNGTPEFPAPPGTNTAGFVEACVVQFDFLDGDGQVDNDRRGVVPTGVSCDSAADGDCLQVGDTASSETFNLSLQCDTGFADLPTSDFADPALSSQQFAEPDVFGAQIFKFAATTDVHAVGSATTKIRLNDPQVENLFGTAGATSVCNWADIGADADSTNDNVTICFRAAGSGTKETFRNTWLTNTGGDRIEVVGTDLGTNTGCLQNLEGGGFAASTKTAVQNGGNGDVITCLESRNGAIGYVDADDTSPDFYGVPVEGVDPDTNDLKELVKCGHYRWWGPLSGGRPNDPGLSDRGNVVPTAFETAHQNSLSNPLTFANNASFLPADGIAMTKTVTDGAYSLAFRPVGCPAAPNAVGTIP